MRLLRWQLPEQPPPKHPYRDSALLHGSFAAIIVLVAWTTAGDLARAGVFAAGFFVIATGWSWSRWRKRFEQERRRREARPGRPRRGGSGRRRAR